LNSQPQPDNQDKNAWRMIGEYTGLAMMVPLAALIGFGIGFFLDAHWHTGRTFEIIGLLLGVAAGLIEIVRVAGRDQS